MDKTKDAIGWFKSTFGAEVAKVAAGTPLTIDFFAAIAMQETYEVWGALYRLPGMTKDKILHLCVGDTIDAPGRGAFPTSMAALLKDPNGAALFKVARDALGDVGTVNTAYHKIFVANPKKFCHGFGIFQYDLQFAKTDPDFFLKMKWDDFGECLAKFMIEMKSAIAAAGCKGKQHISHDDMVYVAIAYNKGSVDRSKGFKQGFRDSSGLYYGELIDKYLTIAESLP